MASLEISTFIEAEADGRLNRKRRCVALKNE
jgi:hypothetical protein